MDFLLLESTKQFCLQKYWNVEIRGRLVEFREAGAGTKVE